jgi:hypothetical protein
MVNDRPRGSKIGFIIGCPRSGTTYVRDLLSSHPKVKTGRESYLFAWYLGPMIRNWNRPGGLETGFSGLRAYLTNDEFHEVLRETSDRFLELMAPNMQADDIFVEKTPNHTLWISEILEVYPEAQFVHVLRDARDVVSSMLAASKTFGKNWAPRYAFVAAHRWVKQVSAAQEAQKKLPSNQYYELRFENLRLNTIKEMRLLADFLQLDWSEEEISIAIEKNDPKYKTTQGAELRGEYAKIYGPTVMRQKGFVRKGKPGSWKEDLKFYDKWQVWLVARNKMREVGYPWKYPW